MRSAVVLCSLDWIRPGDPRTGLGVASMASALRAADVPVTIVADAVNSATFRVDEYIHRVALAVADVGPNSIVGVSAFVWNEPEVRRLLLEIGHSARVVVGGPQVSYVSRGELEALYPEAHLFVRGHGEDAIVALASGKAVLEGEHGIHFAGAEDFAVRAEVDLAALPSPHLDGTLPVGAFLRWETQRGCPFTCSFCQHREAGQRLRRRDLGMSRLEAEMHAFAGARVQRIAVLDPIFHTDRKRAVALLRNAREVGIGARLSLQCRFELVDEAFLDAAGALDVELEFGLQTIHQDEALAVGRPNRLDVADEVIRRLHARGIPFEVSLIYGLPHQTLASFERSVAWCRERDVTRVRAWPLMLLRGAPLDAQRDRWGFVESEGDRIPIVVQSRTFTRDEHHRMAEISQSLS